MITFSGSERLTNQSNSDTAVNAALHKLAAVINAKFAIRHSEAPIETAKQSPLVILENAGLHDQLNRLNLGWIDDVCNSGDPLLRAAEYLLALGYLRKQVIRLLHMHSMLDQQRLDELLTVVRVGDFLTTERLKLKVSKMKVGGKEVFILGNDPSYQQVGELNQSLQAARIAKGTVYIHQQREPGFTSLIITIS